MKVEILNCLSDNYTYVLIDEKSKITCVVDPGEAEPVQEYLERNSLTLKFILNTHHHQDHIGGNQDLKKKFNAKILSFEKDKKRILHQDIYLKDLQIWNYENKFKFKVFHIPGHTSGHICFHFFEDNIVFTGDTLFSLGCGRIFEGTYEQMFNSINLIKSLPPETKIYCGHEYTKNNFDFCKSIDKNNSYLKEKKIFIDQKLVKNIPTVPVTLEQELKTNIFLRCNDKNIKKELGLENASDIETFKKLRDLKDSF